MIDHLLFNVENSIIFPISIIHFMGHLKSYSWDVAQLVSDYQTIRMVMLQ